MDAEDDGDAEDDDEGDALRDARGELQVLAACAQLRKRLEPMPTHCARRAPKSAWPSSVGDGRARLHQRGVRRRG